MRGWRLGLCFSCAPARVPRSNVQQTPITPTTGPISSQRIKPTIGIGTCLLHDPFWVLLWVLHWKAPCHSLSLLNFITAWRPSANLDSDVVPCSCSSRRHVESWWPNKHLQAATTGHNSTFKAATWCPRGSGIAGGGEQTRRFHSRGGRHKTPGLGVGGSSETNPC